MNEFFEIPAARFDFSEDYYRTVTGQRSLEFVLSCPMYAGETLDEYSRIKNDFQFPQFMAKLYEVLLVLEALKGSGRLRSFEQSLDIGSGPAIQSRILKMLGVVNNVVASDIYDGSNRCTDDCLIKYARKFQYLHKLYQMRKLIPRNLRKQINFINNVESKMPYGSKFYGYCPDDRPYNYRIKNAPSIDHYYVGDIFHHDGRYDLISSFMALEYFDFGPIAEKAAQLLKPGGIFVFLVSYWWYPINNTLLYGKFPYLLQQLSHEEALEYYARVHPHLSLDSLDQRMARSDKSRPVMSDYENIAFAKGLRPLKSLRLPMAPDKNERAVLGPMAIDKLPGWNLDRVLQNALRLKPHLTVSDLLTSHVLMLFEKR